MNKPLRRTVNVDDLLDQAFARVNARLSRGETPEPVPAPAGRRDMAPVPEIPRASACRPPAPLSPAQKAQRDAFSKGFSEIFKGAKRGAHTKEDADLIDQHLRTKGVTKCPTRFADASQAGEP